MLILSTTLRVYRPVGSIRCSIRHITPLPIWCIFYACKCSLSNLSEIVNQFIQISLIHVLRRSGKGVRSASHRQPGPSAFLRMFSPSHVFRLTSYVLRLTFPFILFTSHFPLPTVYSFSIFNYIQHTPQTQGMIQCRKVSSTS
jgi:hypothetical protein